MKDATLQASHADLANAIRFLAADAVEKANSGHPGMPMGMADVATVLFTQALKYDPTAPRWADRDRFVLSAGHGSMLLYSLMYLTGYADITLDELKNFRQLGSRTAGHPEYGHLAGAETTTGPLGQGLGNAVGMALAERLMAARFGADVVDHRTYVVVGDGCLMEGISHEAISLAGHLKLNKLIVLFDDNHISIDGPTDLTVSDDQRKRFEASGWNTAAVDGHDAAEIAAALKQARTSDKPGDDRLPHDHRLRRAEARGHIEDPRLATRRRRDRRRARGSWLDVSAVRGARAMCSPTWREAGASAAARIRRAWKKRVARLGAAKRAEFERIMSGELPAGWEDTIRAVKKQDLGRDAEGRDAPVVADRA